MIGIGFLLFMLLTSNPFDRIFPIPLEGRDLNPLLQDFGLAIHPPMLYMGYVGFSVAFAFAIAALIGGQAGRRLGALVAALDHHRPGSSSPSASRSGPGGPTTNWAGAAGGSGTRWKMPPSCPGWSAPP